jgi:ribonucleotide reductase beta subunit family protein with ferritin-like domain
MKTVFNKNKNLDATKQPLFFGEDLAVQRYDTFKYPIFDRLAQQQLGFFWRPEEVSLQKDRNDYAQLSESQKFIFTSNLKYQTMLDSVQGRGPCLAFLPFVTNPELEGAIVAWDFMETIHSRSYTYIIKNLYSDPSEVFDTIIEDKKIEERSKAVTEAYDKLIKLGYQYHTDPKSVDIYELKKALWLALITVNVLEGLRFYVSFACSFAFGELKLMEGSAKILSLIARDESQHLAMSQQIIKAYLTKENDKVMNKVIKDTNKDAYRIYDDAVQQEKDWASYLFSKGSMIGLSEKLLHQYVEYIANRRMRMIGLEQKYEQSSVNNPLPWTQHWFNSRSLQNAPQETEIESYVIGGVKQDVKKDQFKTFKL